MATTRTNLITKYTDKIGVRSKDTALSAYAVGKVFTGSALTAGTDIDAFITPGIFRIDSTIKQSKGNTIPLTDITGFFQVMEINHDEDGSSLKGKTRIRQIFYPDNVENTSPYTRVGTAETYEGVSAANITWSDWGMMGGGALKRVVVDSNDPETINAKAETTYEVFGTHTIILPNPETTPVGTRICVEQYTETSTIKTANGSYTLEASCDIGIPEEGVEASASAVSYFFEVMLNDDDDATREWILDVEHNHAHEIEKINTRITDVEQTIDDVLSVTNDLRARPTKAQVLLAGQKLTLNCEAPKSSTVEDIQKALGTTNNLYFFDMLIFVKGGTSASVLTIPPAGSNIPSEAKITVDLYYNCRVTVSDSTGTVSETFENTDKNRMVLVFVPRALEATGSEWVLLSHFE